MDKYLILEKIHRYVFILCAIMLCVEYDTNIILTVVIGLVSIGLAFLNPVPFVNQILLLIPFLIRVFTHDLYIITWICFIVIFIIWVVMIFLLLQGKRKG